MYPDGTSESYGHSRSHEKPRQPTIGRKVRYLRFHPEPLNNAQLSDSSQIVASCVDGRIRVVDSDEFKVTRSLYAIDE
ncbi:MAG: hypothetical protein CMM07_02225 [Rhodopirellula sp.]|nr:hypothetical protein [Rhodopirellula sp.]